MQLLDWWDLLNFTWSTVFLYLRPLEGFSEVIFLHLIVLSHDLRLRTKLRKRVTLRIIRERHGEVH